MFLSIVLLDQIRLVIGKHIARAVADLDSQIIDELDKPVRNIDVWHQRPFMILAARILVDRECIYTHILLCVESCDYRIFSEVMA